MRKYYSEFYATVWIAYLEHYLSEIKHFKPETSRWYIRRKLREEIAQWQSIFDFAANTIELGANAPALISEEEVITAANQAILQWLARLDVLLELEDALYTLLRRSAILDKRPKEVE